MSILASLVNAYARLPNPPPFGYSMEKIGLVILLHADGTLAHVIDWRTGEGKKKQPRPMLVPQPIKRTAGIAPNFLWDKTSYVLGVTAGEGKRTAEEHKAFIERHVKDIGGSEDEGLKALLLFLQNWQPEQFTAPEWPQDAKDLNVIFALESEHRANLFLHDRPEAKRIWMRLGGASDSFAQICLVTGEPAPVARLHPSIKGVWGAQSSGAAIVSFNLDAFASYGHEQGDNAPVSEGAAFAYTTALNRFLERDSGHRIQIGDASTVFWADASDMAADAEAMFRCFIEPPDEKNETPEQASEEQASEERNAAIRLHDKLKRLRNGEMLESIAPALAKGVRFYVLGLAPNASRLSIRFYYEDDFGVLARHYQRYVEDMKIEPPPRDGYPPLWRYLLETAVLGKRENVAPNLAGEWMRAILTGTPYPLTLMASVLTRIRADGTLNAERAAILKAVLIRTFKRKEVPVALDPENKNRGYLLGRLFALYEQIQSAALGTKVNATIKDKFYGSASAQPRKVFSVLESGSAHHLSKLGKQKPGYRVVLEKQVTALMECMSPEEDPFPAALSAQEQALFGLGYYHQRSEFFKKATHTTLQGESEP